MVTHLISYNPSDSEVKNTPILHFIEQNTEIHKPYIMCPMLYSP